MRAFLRFIPNHSEISRAKLESAGPLNTLKFKIKCVVSSLYEPQKMQNNTNLVLPAHINPEQIGKKYLDLNVIQD